MLRWMREGRREKRSRAQKPRNLVREISGPYINSE